MARISSELAARAVGSKYDLVLIGARRARELNRGWRPTVTCDNRILVLNALSSFGALIQ